MSTNSCYTIFNSPIGSISLLGDGDFLTGAYLSDHKGWAGPGVGCRMAEEPFAQARQQLEEYFAGTRRDFDLPLKLSGTDFQEQVWQELRRIPFGETITYAELARRIAKPTASRAVGAANGRNPVSILVPCHRVVGANGQLTGYAGGVDQKRWLLQWEADVVASSLAQRERVGDLCVHIPPVQRHGPLQRVGDGMAVA